MTAVGRAETRGRPSAPLRRVGAAVLLGLLGAGVLVWLGVWQVQRLEWKEAILADIEARIAAAPEPVPATPDPAVDRYLPVEAEGTIVGGGLRVLASVKGIGPGHRLISVFETDGGRRLLIDRGFLPERAGAVPPPPDGAVTVRGNLHWPDEIDGFTPAPDREAELWFARDVPAMAEALDTEPVLIVAREVSGAAGPVVRLPVSTAGIPNDHFEYAVTWFSLAAVWLAMTGLLIRRIWQRAR